MFNLLPINYIYQINANLAVFNFKYKKIPEFIKPLEELALRTALLFSKNYESCQMVAYLETLERHKTKI